MPYESSGNKQVSVQIRRACCRVNEDKKKRGFHNLSKLKLRWFELLFRLLFVKGESRLHPCGLLHNVDILNGY